MNFLEYFKYKINKKEFKLQQQIKSLHWLEEYSFKTIIDVGANEGQFAEKMTRLFPNAGIYCFEPLPSVFEKLKNNFASKPNFTFHNFGLADCEAVVTMHENEYSPSSSMLEMLELHKSNFSFAVNSKEVKVKVERLDHFFQRNLDDPILLKIDVQGYELPVLLGGQSVLSRCRMVIVETSFHPLYKNQHLFADLYEHLTVRGFRFVGNLEQLVAKNGKMLQGDSVFLRD